MSAGFSWSVLVGGWGLAGGLGRGGYEVQAGEGYGETGCPGTCFVEVGGGQGEFEPDGVDREVAGGEPAVAGVLAGADAVLDSGVGAGPSNDRLPLAANAV